MSSLVKERLLDAQEVDPQNAVLLQQAIEQLRARDKTVTALAEKYTKHAR